MRPERRKRHHYIPVFLQKHFCDADGMLWYGIRDIQEVKRVSPRDAFVEKELYTSYEEAHERPNDIAYEPDDRYEREFAELESRAAPAIEKLVAGTRHLVDGSSTDLLRSMSSAEITACKELLISLTNRTPDAMKSAIARSRPRSSDAISKLDLRPLRRFPDAVQDTFLQRLEWSAMAHVASSSHRHVPGGSDLHRCGLAVAAYSNPSSRFIIGSCGVAQTARRGRRPERQLAAHLSQQRHRTGRRPRYHSPLQGLGRSMLPDQRGAGKAQQTDRGRLQKLG